MSENAEPDITSSVLQSMVGTPNPRLKQVMTSLISHLHDFIRDVEPTEEEWLRAIDFLTRTGQQCDDRREEETSGEHAATLADRLAKGDQMLSL